VEWVRPRHRVCARREWSWGGSPEEVVWDEGGGEAASPPRGPTHLAFVRGRGPSSLIRLRQRLFVSRSGLGVC
jgi:hypothetical protein